MAGPSRTLTLKLLADSSAFTRGVRAAQGDLDGFGAKLGRFATNGAKLLAGLTVAAGGAAVAIGANLFRAFEEGEKAEAVIRNIVTQMGNFAGATDQVTKRITDQAEALAAMVGVEDEVIAAGQGILLTFASVNATANTPGGIFDRATAATLDLQAAGFGNVESNATQLGKALQNPIKGLTALTRSGVDFTDAERDLIAALVESGDLLAAQDVILDAVEKQVGGTAAASASASDLIRIRFGLIRDEIAEKLGPAFERLSGFVLDRVIPAFDEFARENGPAIGAAFAAIATFVEETLLPRLEDLWAFFRDNVLPVLEELAAFILDEVVPALSDLADWFQQHVTPVVSELWQAVETNLLPILRDFWDFLTVTLIPTLQAVFEPALAAIRDLIEDLSEKVSANRDAWNALSDDLAPIFDFIRDDLAPAIGEDLALAIAVVNTLLGTQLELWQRTAEAIEKVVDAIKRADRALRNSPYGDVYARLLAGLGENLKLTLNPFAGLAEAFSAPSTGNLVPERPTMGTTANTTYEINVTGTVVDPEGTARAIQRVLLDSERRVGTLAYA